MKNENMPDIISEVFAIIKNRQAEMPKGSYTTKLFKKGEKTLLLTVINQNNQRSYLGVKIN